jgi:hypothetical protein
MPSKKIKQLLQLQEKTEKWLQQYENHQLNQYAEARIQFAAISKIANQCKAILKQQNDLNFRMEDLGSVKISEDKLKQRVKIEKEVGSSFLPLDSNFVHLLQGNPTKEEDCRVKWNHLLSHWAELSLALFSNQKNIILSTRCVEFKKEAELFIQTVDNNKNWIEPVLKLNKWIEQIDLYLVQFQQDSAIIKLWSQILSHPFILNIENLDFIWIQIQEEESKLLELVEVLNEFKNATHSSASSAWLEKNKKAEQWLHKLIHLQDNFKKWNDFLQPLPSVADRHKQFSLRFQNIQKKLKEQMGSSSELRSFLTDLNIWTQSITPLDLKEKSSLFDDIHTWQAQIQLFLDMEGKEISVSEANLGQVCKLLDECWESVKSFPEFKLDQLSHLDLLAYLKNIRFKIFHFISLAHQFVDQFETHDKSKQVREWLIMANQWVVQLSQHEKLACQFNELSIIWDRSIWKNPGEQSLLKIDELFSQAVHFEQGLKRFLVNGTASGNKNWSEKIRTAENWLQSLQIFADQYSSSLDSILSDKDSNQLPDWFDKISGQWEQLTQLIDRENGSNPQWSQGLAQFKKEADLFVRIATKKGGEWLEKANQIKVYLKSAEQILSQVSGFIQDIEEKDFLSVYEKIKQSWNSIKPENDLIPNANWDNKLMAELYQVKNKAESWLANVLTGSRAGGQMTDEVKQIWSAIDSILTLSLTKHKIPDFSHLYKKNQFQVEYPEAEQLNSNQVKELIAIYSGGMKGEKNNILVTALNRVNQEIIVLGNTIDETYKATLASGGASAQVFIHAKQEFDAVMKKQKQIENVLETVRKAVVGAITLALTPVNPIAAAAVGTLLSGSLNSFSDLVGFVGKTASQSSGKLGNMGAIISAILPANQQQSIMSKADHTGLVEISDVFNRGITHYYQEIKSKIAQIQEELDKIYKSLYTLADETIEDTEKLIAVGLHLWGKLYRSIQENYIQQKAPKINETVAYWLLGRAQYASWLIQKKDTMIIDDVIDQLEKYKILKEASVEWDKGPAGDIAKGLGWLLGNWASFGYAKKVKSLQLWAIDEIDQLNSSLVWQKIYA